MRHAAVNALPADSVRIPPARAGEPFPFDHIYGAWWDRVVVTDARAALIALPLGIAAAGAGGPLDALCRLLSLVGVSVPGF